MNPAPYIYLDNNATTAVDPDVFAAMRPFLENDFANPSSPYTFARASSDALRTARARVAALVHTRADQISFTSCATEANNQALFSALSVAPQKRHIVTTQVEHASVLAYCKHLEGQGFRVSYLPVDPQGTLDLDELDAAITDDTAVVSVMLANNETGVIFPVKEFAARAHAKGALFHTDAVQAAGKRPLDLEDLGIDYASLSAHKLHGPKGIGALYAREHLPVRAYVMGGAQENGRRGGTENVAGIVGFGKAAELAAEHLPDMAGPVRDLRDKLEQRLKAQLPMLHIAGQAAERLTNTSSLLFEGLTSDAILALIDMKDICCSSGSACAAGASEPSHVLRAMGIPPNIANGVLRVSLSRYTTADDIDRLVSELIPVVMKLAGRRAKR